MRRYDREDQWTPCPKCDCYLLPLRDYEAKHSSDEHEIQLGYWSILTPLINLLDDLFAFKLRQNRLAKIKAEVLPQFPQSLVCPKCFHVARRSGR